MVREVGWDIDRLHWRFQDTFRGVCWQGKDVCEIGCGRGDLALYMALNGARHVVALEPVADGSSDTSLQILESRLARLRPSNLTFVPDRFEDYACGPESFDVIFGIAVINHTHETRFPLGNDPEALQHYQQVFHKFHGCLRPGGALVLTDVSRRSVWSLIQQLTRSEVRSPLAPSIDWKIHQQPCVWQRLAREAHFAHSAIHWRVPYPLRTVPWLADNRLFQYFTDASFILVARKAAASPPEGLARGNGR
jgi:cyclopropane fatty-acyl-phospholipid synthase-like methyltransferase